MKHVITLLLAAMLAAFGVVLYVQHGDAAPVRPKAVAIATAKPAEAPRPAPPLARTLRTVALGWELLAPGVVASERGAFKDASFTAVATMADLEAALARGGGDATGADIAIVPLSSYVASYERLRALAPDVIFVIGWSRGREVLYGPDPSALAKPARAVKLAGAAGAPETFLALFLLDLAGVPASKVELADHAPLTAMLATAKQKAPGKLIISSADTPALMPIVAVAPRGFVTAHRAELERWAKSWLDGVGKLAEDVPAGGRLVATLQGAPPVVGIIEALGQLEFANLRENAVAVGLAGRGALGLPEIFQTTWRIWRDAGVLTTPAPETMPLDTALVAALVRANPNSVTEVARPRPADGKRPQVLLVVREDGKLEPEAFVARIGYVAGVFDRLPLRISIKNDPKTAQLLADMARDRFGLRPAQLVAGKQPPAGTATIEVLTTP